jgi:hypothetical protein
MQIRAVNKQFDGLDSIFAYRCEGVCARAQKTSAFTASALSGRHQSVCVYVSRAQKTRLTCKFPTGGAAAARQFACNLYIRRSQFQLRLILRGATLRANFKRSLFAQFSPCSADPEDPSERAHTALDYTVAQNQTSLSRAATRRLLFSVQQSRRITVRIVVDAREPRARCKSRTGHSSSSSRDCAGGRE